MSRQPASPIATACERRFPAWTLYARTLSGSRADADDLVRGAVTRALRLSDSLATEDEAHDHVLEAIRTSALELLERRQLASGRSASGGHPASPSVLGALQERADAAALRRAADHVVEASKRLPGEPRRIVELLLTDRPALGMPAAARRLGIEIKRLARGLASALDALAVGLRSGPTNAAAGPHPRLEALVAYVNGALSGDEARAVVAHCSGCGVCGDRLGTMILLRSWSARSARRPRFSRELKVAAVAVGLAVAVLAGALLVRGLWPNPWDDYATRASVPGWYQQFFYGGRRPIDPRRAAVVEGLELLVRGDVAAAIERLEPQVGDPVVDPEAAAYLGIAHYLAGDSSGRTVDLLTVGGSSSRAGRLAGWYLANTFLARGDLPRARRELERLAWIGDWVGRQAEALLARLDRAA